MIKPLFFIISSIMISNIEATPLWEFGMGLAGLNFPHYRGSQNQQNYLLPFPYFVYRGERLKADRDGLRGILFQSKRILLDISMDGAVPVDSDDNTIRHGMPDLDSVFEIGPSLKIDIVHNLSFIVPVRAAFSTDVTHLNIHNEGWLCHPKLGYVFENTAHQLKVSMDIGPLYATQPYHDYYYSVDAQYATLGRSQYKASGGYSGLRMAASLSWQVKNVLIGAFIRYDDLKGSVFEDSPLVEQKYSLMAGFALSWSLKYSDKHVTDD